VTRHAGAVPPDAVIELRELGDPTEPAYATTVDGLLRIYLASFPEAERIPPEDLLDSNSNRISLVGTSAATGRVIGFCSFVPIPDHAAALVEYLATDPSVRSSGLGSRLLTQCADTARQSGATHLFMELEQPDHADSPEDAARRIAFYRRNGCKQAPWLDEYLVPDLRGPSRAIPMLLFVKNLTEPPAYYEPSALFEALYQTTYGEAGAWLLPGLVDAVRRGGGR
jgi:GNAT superfamily N-acetyltransferase